MSIPIGTIVNVKDNTHTWTVEGNDSGDYILARKVGRGWSRIRRAAAYVMPIGTPVGEAVREVESRRENGTPKPVVVKGRCRCGKPMKTEHGGALIGHLCAIPLRNVKARESWTRILARMGLPK